MNRLVFILFSLPLLLSLITSADAGPACARRSQDSDACIDLCKKKWGWPGFAVGTDRWGSVLTATKTNDLGALVTQACRVRPSGALGTAPTTATTSANRGLPSSSLTAPANVQVSASVSTASISSVSLAPFAANTTSLSLELFSTTRSRSVTSISSVKPTKFVTSSSTKPSTTISSTRTTPTTTSTPPPPPPPTTTSTKTSTTPKTTTTPKATTSTTKAPEPTQSPPDTSSGATSQGDINQYLQAHNSVRSQHGAAALSWSDDLAAKAQEWANNCVFQHSGGKLGKFGENLAAGTGGSYGIGPAVKSWTDEVSDYDSSNPQASHFTQVVWKGTQQVGCAVQSCNGIFDASFGPAKYFVCEYFPQGNIIGQFDQNVQA
ncbi:CAP domain-containing protein [Fomes fomentarius]|nr:CAP domain-containing protein [Fomes fomentarius]